MFKLVVLSILVAVALSAPVPGLLHGGYSAHAIPTAISHQSRIDVHSSPIITTYHAVAPAVHEIHAPVISSAVSHQARYDIHRSAAVIAAPVAHGYSALPYAHGYGSAVPALHAW